MINFDKQKLIYVGVAAAGLALVISGVVWHQKQKSPPPVEVLSSETDSLPSPIVSEIVVDVSGAVSSPGVYHLPFGSRVADALDKSGGLTKQADQQWVDKNLDRAAKLTDGQKIYIPQIGQNAGVETAATENNLVNINTASAAELDALPGVGPVTAQAIISGRPYGDVSELTGKNVIKASVFAKIKDLIGVY